MVSWLLYAGPRIARRQVIAILTKPTPRKQLQRKQHRRRSRVLTASAYLALQRGERYLPPVIRGLLGLLLMFLGLLGFLPILGFWMIPLGLALLATDIPPIRRWLRHHLAHSRRRHKPSEDSQEP